MAFGLRAVSDHAFAALTAPSGLVAPSAPPTLVVPGQAVSAQPVSAKTLGTGSGGVNAGTIPYTVGTNIRVTAIGAEVWASNPTPPLQVTQAGAEVWASNTAPPLLVTQAGAEVWVDISTPYVPPVLTATQDPIICVIT